jgi:hypothetical protein
VVPTVLRIGLRSNSPPQFGHVFFISSAHDAQNVHSKLQMAASFESAGNAALHRSHVDLISSISGPRVKS